VSLLNTIRSAATAFNETTPTQSTQEIMPRGKWLRTAWSSLTNGMPTRTQADVALHSVAAQINSQQPLALPVDIVVPPNRSSLSDYEIRSALVKRVLEEAGVPPSKAAVEEVVGRLSEHHYADAGDPLHQSVRLGKPQEALIDGHKVRFYRMQVDGRSRTDILKLKGLAAEVTKAGTRAVHDQTPDERWASVKQIYNEKYATASNRQALAEIFSLQNIGLLGAAEVGMATPAAPFIVAGGTSILMIEGAQAHGTALEIKQLTYAPQKPSDLEVAAQKLAQLATQGKVLAGTAMLGGAAHGGAKLGARITEGITRPPAAMPEALTPEGVRVHVPTDAPLVSTHAEMRGRGAGGGASFEQRVRATRPELAPEQFKKVIDGDKLTQATGITNQQAADHIGFKRIKGGYEVYISEITTGNKDLNLLAKQLEGGANDCTRR